VSQAVTPEFQSPPTVTPTTVVVGQTVTAQANAGSAAITWDFGDGTQVAGATHAYTLSGLYTVTATAAAAPGFGTEWQTQVFVGLPTVGGVGVQPDGIILVGGPGLGARAGASAKLACN